MNAPSLRILLATFTCAGLLLISSGDADARSQRVSQIPNNAWSCSACHSSSRGVLAPMGLTIYDEGLSEFGPAGVVEWAEVFDIDSDGDGYTNGEELGDPMGTWVIGDPDPVAEFLSNPSDPRDIPAPAEADDDGVPDDMDNCPRTPNEDQADADMDTIGDACDAPPIDENSDENSDENAGEPDDGDNSAVIPDVTTTNPHNPGAGPMDMGGGGTTPADTVEPPSTAEPEEGCAQSGLRGAGSPLPLVLVGLGLVLIAARRRT